MNEPDSRITRIQEGRRAKKGMSLGPFTQAPLSLEELMEKQGVRGPQGLAAFVDPEWEPGEESDRFLEAIIAKND